MKLCCLVTSCEEIKRTFKKLEISLKTGVPPGNFCIDDTLLTSSSPPRLIKRSLVPQKPFPTTVVDSES